MKNTEEWAVIKYSPNYMISTHGNVLKIAGEGRYSRNVGQLMKLTDRDGYKRIRLRTTPEKVVTFSVHRLVAEHFIPNPEGKRCVNHIDGSRDNNCVDNLEWCTHSENTQHGYAIGSITRPKGSKHHMSKLKEHQVIEIRQRLKTGETCYKLGKEYGVNEKTISQIRDYKRWKHV